MERIKNFSKDPTYRNSEHLTLWQKLLFYTWSTYSVEEKKGNIEKAREIRKILSPELKKFICLDIRGLRSILLGCKLLLQLNQKKMTHMDIYIGNNKSFEVYYNYYKDLPGMFFVNQTDKDFGVDKELSLYYEGIVDYFKDMFRNFNSKKVSKIKFVISDREKAFYSEKLGVIWNEEDCADCALQSLKGEVTSEKCKQLIIKRCYDSFRHSPLLEINIIEKTKKIDKSDYKECPVCSVFNPKTLKKCQACESDLGDEPKPKPKPNTLFDILFRDSGVKKMKR